MDVFKDQELMMTAYGNTVDKVNPEQAKLYIDLMIEEQQETLTALAPEEADRIAAACDVLRSINTLARIKAGANNPEVMDGLVDVLVVTLGAGMSFDFPMRQAWNKVWESNMSKTDPETGKVIKNEHGKVQKPPHYMPAGPELASMLKLYRGGLLPPLVEDEAL